MRAQATLGGNLCAGGTSEVPRGDLQGALLALDAQVRSDGAGGERSESLEHFLGARDGRLLLSVSYEEPAAGAFEYIRYPHTHTYTVLAVSAVRAQDGDRSASQPPAWPGRPHACGPPSAQPTIRPQRELQPRPRSRSRTMRSRRPGIATKTLPVLVRRALTTLKESA